MAPKWHEQEGLPIEVAARIGALAGGGVRVAVLALAHPQAGIAVRYPDEADPVAARATIRVQPSDVGREVLVALERGDPRRPIVIGLLQDEPVLPPAEAAPAARVDGRTVCIEGSELVELRCGNASITLDATGRIVVKGAEIVSRARGTHKIRGASVLIN